MAQKDSDGPSLELPSFGFGRRRRRRSEPELDTTPAEPDESAPPDPDAGPDTPVEPVETPHPRRLPVLGTAPAVVVAGLLAGALLVGLTWGSLHLCELVRGTSSCGNPGVVLLLVAVALAVLLGRAVLTGLGVDEAGGTSFLGVSLVTVVALLVSDLLLEWWMLVVIPVLAVVAFALAHWVSTAFVEPTEDWMHR